MKVMNKLLVVGAMITSFAPMAAVDVSIDRNISAVVVHGEEVGFFVKKKSNFEFDNGTNQIVVRVAQLVSNFGEKEKFNSYPVVITFDASDTSLDVGIESAITRVEQAEAFNKDPRFIITDKSGNEIKVKQDILPASSGISRDYVVELERYNSKHSINVATIAIGSSTIVDTSNKISTSVSQPTQMVEYWYEKSSSEEKMAFSDWAFDNRRGKELEAIEGSKALEMASYWFIQSSSNERKQTLAWLLEQE